TFADATVAATTATFSAPGIYVLQLLGNDGALQTTDTVTITVHSDPALNTAPVVNAGASQDITNPVTSVFLTATVTDDGLPIPTSTTTFTFSLHAALPISTFADATVAATTATFSAPGIYVLQLLGNDGALQTTDTVTITVHSDPALNTAPVVN